MNEYKYIFIRPYMSALTSGSSFLPLQTGTMIPTAPRIQQGQQKGLLSFLSETSLFLPHVSLTALVFVLGEEAGSSKGCWDSATDKEGTLDCFLCLDLNLVACIFNDIQVTPDKGRIKLEINSA